MFDMSFISSKVKSAMKTIMFGNKTDSDYSFVIETDFKHDLEGVADDDCPTFYDGDDLYVMDELQNFIRVKDEIEAAISDSCHRNHQCQIILPKTLTSRVSEDIVRMSLSEPCGVHGCAIYVDIQDKGKSYPLTTLFGNACVPPTFEIHLTLREDNCGWNKLHKAFLAVKGRILNTKWKVAPKILLPSYQLEKRKLYRSAGSIENIQKSLKV